MARIREEDYAYATARIRAIETKLMDKNKLDRLMDMTDPAQTAKLLMESGYGIDHVENSKDGTHNVEALLSSELKKAYDLLVEILPNPQVIDLFKRRYDYLNGKLILKAEFLGIDVMKSLSPMGTVKPEKLFRMITDRKMNDLPETFANAVLESIEAFSQTRDPQAIDFIMDRASFENMAIDAKETEEPYLQELVRRLADTANIRVFIRAKLISGNRELVSKALVNGGSVPEKTYEELADKSLDQFFEALKFTELAGLSPELSEAVKHPGGISQIEKVLDDSITRYLKQSKYVAMGIEPVIAYLFFKETEIKNARLIITGQVNKISQETIKERLRLGYA